MNRKLTIVGMMAAALLMAAPVMAQKPTVPNSSHTHSYDPWLHLCRSNDRHEDTAHAEGKLFPRDCQIFCKIFIYESLSLPLILFI